MLRHMHAPGRPVNELSRQRQRHSRLPSPLDFSTDYPGLTASAKGHSTADACSRGLCARGSSPMVPDSRSQQSWRVHFGSRRHGRQGFSCSTIRSIDTEAGRHRQTRCSKVYAAAAGVQGSLDASRLTGVSHAALNSTSLQIGSISTESVQAGQEQLLDYGAAAHVSVSNAGDANCKSSSNTTGTKLGRHSHRLVIRYDGTAYYGWQLQLQYPTVQLAMEKALSRLLQEDRLKLGTCAAGRTDTGVHARGQVVQFFTDAEPDALGLPFRLNALLPRDIRVLSAHRTAPDYSVTASATRKIYHYHIHMGQAHDPIMYRFQHHERRPLDVAVMRAGAKQFIGRHDFTQFSNDHRDRLSRNPVKTVIRFDIFDAPDNCLRLEVEGNGFLYKQIRHMTGSLLAVGMGKMPLESIAERLALASSTVPGGVGGRWRGYNVAEGKGLFLQEVHYPPYVDDPTARCFPTLPHDECGRVVGGLPGPPPDD